MSEVVIVNLIAIAAGVWLGVWMFRVRSSLEMLKKNSIRLNNAMMLTIEKMNEVVDEINSGKENKR